MVVCEYVFIWVPALVVNFIFYGSRQVYIKILPLGSQFSFNHVFRRCVGFLIFSLGIECDAIFFWLV